MGLVRGRTFRAWPIADPQLVAWQVVELTADTINRGLFGIIAVCLTAFAHILNRIYTSISERFTKVEDRVREMEQDYTEMRVAIGALPDRRRHPKED